MRSREAQEQCIVIQWCNLQSNKYPELEYIFHCPNGGKRGKIEAHNLILEGFKSGVPDLLLLTPKGKYIGLAIEMKWGKNKCTPNQIRWLEWLHKQGYKCKICHSADEAIQAIKNYLNKG